MMDPQAFISLLQLWLPEGSLVGRHILPRLHENPINWGDPHYTITYHGDRSGRVLGIIVDKGDRLNLWRNLSTEGILDLRDPTSFDQLETWVKSLTW
jgi:hypothetical protein